jgi:catechol-2,3-dioxygenase
MPGIARMRAVVLDCPDPKALAEFYRALVGGEITYEDDEWVALRDGGSVVLSFQKVDDHRPPDWPEGDQAQQFHIDVTVDDVDAAEAAVLALGATKHASQPGDPGAGAESDDMWRVFLDPAGHPFCLCWD